MRYLTNLDLKNGPAVTQAAENLGLEIYFQDTPMPSLDDPYDHMYDDGYRAPYNPESLMGICGCVVSYESPKRDLSDFWLEYNRIIGRE